MCYAPCIHARESALLLLRLSTQPALALQSQLRKEAFFSFLKARLKTPSNACYYASFKPMKVHNALKTLLRISMLSFMLVNKCIKYALNAFTSFLSSASLISERLNREGTLIFEIACTLWKESGLSNAAGYLLAWNCRHPGYTNPACKRRNEKRA